MRYFIDLEATQYTQEIISIGCVREDGKKFKSLIKPKNLRTVTKFITDLTGITREMLKEEKTSDEVFEQFFNWLSTDRSLVQFYCYGNSDIKFLTNNLKNRTNSFKAQAALSLISFNLHDYSEDVKEHFKLKKSIALNKVMCYYYPNNSHVWHDALSDAEMLRQVYFGVEHEEKVKGVPFPDYLEIPTFKTECDFESFTLERTDSKGNTVTYETLKDAVTIIEPLLMKQHGEASGKHVSRKIMSAINNSKKYFGYTWNVQVRRDTAICI